MATAEKSRAVKARPPRGCSVRTQKRLRLVEELYLAGNGPTEIHAKVFDQYPVTYQTIRNDITKVRKAWGADLDAQNRLEGRHRYLASLRQLRRKALIGGPKGPDFRLVHQLDQEVARLSGVNLKVDDKTIKLDIEAARGFMEKVMAVVFEVVTDSDQREDLLDRLDNLEPAG